MNRMYLQMASSPNTTVKSQAPVPTRDFTVSLLSNMHVWRMYNMCNQVWPSCSGHCVVVGLPCQFVCVCVSAQQVFVTILWLFLRCRVCPDVQSETSAAHVLRTRLPVPASSERIRSCVFIPQVDSDRLCFRRHLLSSCAPWQVPVGVVT